MAPRKKKSESLRYPGPSWSDVQAMSDADVDRAFVTLKHQPRKYMNPDDDNWFIAAHGDKDEDFVWTPEEIKALRQRVYAWHRDCLKGELFRTHIERWITALSVEQCWSLIEEYESAKPSLNEKRYTPIDKVRLRAASAAGRREQTTTNREEKQ